MRQTQITSMVRERVSKDENLHLPDEELVKGTHNIANSLTPTDGDVLIRGIGFVMPSKGG